jgi:hypothetical protein
VKIGRLLLILLLLILVVLLKPKTVWSEFLRVRSQWNTILSLLVIVVAVYLIFGFWTAFFAVGMP